MSTVHKPTFQIVKEKAPTRCDICHQADQFDPLSEMCLRCQPLVAAGKIPQPELELPRNHSLSDQFLESIFRPHLSAGDVLSIIQDAVQLLRNNFRLLASIVILIEIPAMLGILFAGNDFLLRLFLPPGPFKSELVLWLAITVLTSLSHAALVKAIFDRSQGNETSVRTVFQFLWRRGLRFAATIALGRVYQFVGFLFCGILGFYTYPSGAFIPEIAVIEERSLAHSFRESNQLSLRNWFLICGYGVFCWLIPVILLLTLSSWDVPLSRLVFPYALMRVFLSPFFQAVKTLLYFRLTTPPPPNGGEITP